MESAIVAAVRAAGARRPEGIALVSGGETLTYAELERRAAAAASHVAARAHGDIVGLLLPNTLAFVTNLLGALWAGKTVAVLPTLAPPPLLQVMAAEAGLQTILTSSDLAGRLAETKATPVILDPAAATDPAEIQPRERTHPAAILLYTSGTTGRPKAVALSDANILANAEGSRQAAGFGDDEVMLAILPLFHAFGLTVTLILPLIQGCAVVLVERFIPRAVLNAIESHRVTSLVGVPSQYRLLTKEPTQADTASLRFCIAGAERLPEQVARDFEGRFSCPLLQGYGATEASPVISLNPPRANRPLSVGRPLPNVRVSLREDGQEVAVGETGEIWVEGPNVMLGYHNRSQATAEKLVEGALRTGDRGYLDREGYLHLAGRADDLIKVAGEKVYPAEVEQALERIDGVEEAAVIGVPEEKHGAALRAFVQARAGTTLTEAGLRAACRADLEASKIPRSFVLLEQFPRTPSGKVDKRALAALERS
ncbi:MAG: class I adenylate-forming enzyme family protein [Terriglobia bacterium]